MRFWLLYFSGSMNRWANQGGKYKKKVFNGVVLFVFWKFVCHSLAMTCIKLLSPFFIESVYRGIPNRYKAMDNVAMGVLLTKDLLVGREGAAMKHKTYFSASAAQGSIA